MYTSIVAKFEYLDLFSLFKRKDGRFRDTSSYLQILWPRRNVSNDIRNILKTLTPNTYKWRENSEKVSQKVFKGSDIFSSKFYINWTQIGPCRKQGTIFTEMLCVLSVAKYISYHIVSVLIYSQIDKIHLIKLWMPRNTLPHQKCKGANKK